MRRLDEDTRGILLGALGFTLMLIGGYLMMVLGYVIGVN